MDQPCFFEHRQCIEQLGSKDFDELCTQPTKRVLFDELVEIGREQLKDEAKVVFVNERVSEPENVMFVVRIIILVEHLQNRDLHHTLVKVRRLVFDDFDGDNLVCPSILAFYNLTECALTEYVENQVLVAFFAAKEIVHVEDVIIILVIIAIVVSRLAWLCEDSPGVCG